MENKQTNKQKSHHKSHPTWSLHKPLDQTEEGRNQKGRRIQLSSKKEFNFPLSLGKGDFKHNKFKKKKKKEKRKAEKYFTNEGTTINTEVQINEEEIGKLRGKEFRIMIVKIMKNFENKREKMEESINKDLEN